MSVHSLHNHNISMNSPVPCWIYKSSRKEDMYLYLPQENDFDQVPVELLDPFGPPKFVMQLDLHPERVLAREDVTRVMENLRTQGFHLQMPPTLVPEMYYGNDL